MSRPNLSAPLLPTPKVVTQGSVSKPKAQPKPSFQAPLLATPRVEAASKIVRRIA